MDSDLILSSRAPGSHRFPALQRLGSRLLALEIFAVGGLVAASMALERILPVAALAPAAFWVIRLATEGRLTRRTFSDFGILLLALMVPVTLWATVLPDKTLPQVYRLLSGILLYYTVVNWVTQRQRLRLLLNGVIAAGLLLALIAPFGVAWEQSKIPFFTGLSDRLVLLLSDVIHANVMAATIGLFLPLSASMLLFGWGRLRYVERILAGLALLAGTVVLALTLSRSGMLAFAVALAVLALLRGRWGWVLLAIGLVGAGYSMYRFGPQQIFDLILFDLSLQGLDGRVEIWSRAYYMLQDFPFTGVGMGLYGDVADLLYPFFLSPPGRIPHAHNLFLQIGVDLGVPGLLGWLAALIGILWAASQTYLAGLDRNDNWLRGLGAGLLASQVAMLTHGLTDAAIWGMVKPAPLVWLIWGLAAAAWLVARRTPHGINSAVTVFA